jgi:ADP-heptose:LPS heptosyltransferase
LKQVLLLDHRWALGDTVLFAGLARDIQLNHPNQYNIYVNTHFSDVWQNSPYATPVKPAKLRVNPITISYRPGIRMAGRGNKIHMLSEYHRDFEKKTGLKCPVRMPKGDIHLTPAEKEPLVSGRYWVIQAGGKLDMTNKFWWYDRYQQVVNRLAKLGVHCVQSGVRHNRHRHPDLENCVNVVDKLRSTREFFNLIYNAEGFIGPITGGMHVAACFDKPCVVLAGGREEPWWESYTNAYNAFGPQCGPVKVEHRFLHTLGLLSCCETKGCWKKRVVPIDPADTIKNADKLCKMPVQKDNQAVAQCLDMITVDHVVEAVMSYYEDNTLPPIGEPRGAYPDDDEEFETPKLVPLKDLPPVIKLPPVQHKPKLLKQPEPRKEPEKPIVAPPPNAPPPPSFQSAAHPIIGGKYTVCVLCYGPYPELAKRCIGSILDSTPPEMIDLRVACNECSPETLKYLSKLPITKTYVHQKNKKKYPVMREMFWDETCPIKTNYVLWFDDDTQIVDSNWLVRLSDTIVANHPHGNRMYGTRLTHDLRAYAKGGHRPDTWFRQGDWFKGVNFKVRGRQMEAPNGSMIEFAVGYFWALATETIRRGNIPDVRLNHNGGDITIGEQVHQAGGKIKMFNKDKVHVWCPKKEAGGRRGFSENFPWASPVKVRR